MRISSHGFAGLFKYSYRHFPRYCRKLIEKRIQRITFFQVIEQVLDRYAGPRKHRRSALDFWVNYYDRSFHDVFIFTVLPVLSVAPEDSR